MKVRKVALDDLDSTYCCVNEASPNALWTEGLSEAREWFKVHLNKYVEGYHLFDGDKVIGFIYYSTSERALVPYEIEPRVACIYCTEILRDYRYKRNGKLMFDYAKTDLFKYGFKGIMVPATDFKEWMYYELFLKQRFQVIKEHAPYKVMYFPLLQQNIDINPLELNYTPSEDRVEVTLFKHFFCPAGVYMYNLIKNVANRFEDKVKLVEIEATVDTVRKYGTTDPLINGKIKILGPTTEEEVIRSIQEEIDQF
ncbi:MAG: GNAT family N-acetyltransferase [Candidatus Hodarchaeota archaeon]